jgi:hypothetical protein
LVFGFRDTLVQLSQGIVLKRKLQKRPAEKSAGLLLLETHLSVAVSYF